MKINIINNKNNMKVNMKENLKMIYMMGKVNIISLMVMFMMGNLYIY